MRSKSFSTYTRVRRLASRSVPETSELTYLPARIVQCSGNKEVWSWLLRLSHPPTLSSRCSISSQEIVAFKAQVVLGRSVLTMWNRNGHTTHQRYNKNQEALIGAFSERRHTYSTKRRPTCRCFPFLRSLTHVISYSNERPSQMHRSPAGTHARVNKDVCSHTA